MSTLARPSATLEDLIEVVVDELANLCDADRRMLSAARYPIADDPLETHDVRGQIIRRIASRMAVAGPAPR